ncbi:DNA cytosine methyltransferase [Lactococcus petauri]|uniref:DNA cytosine methyltransferase n=1 Tax=Lactococcus petauri TaxID=1940789 RepID=UPI0022E919AD|nr:DNA (cytosine-5-)-methyltransferase [Lactococcus petauri]
MNKKYKAISLFSGGGGGDLGFRGGFKYLGKNYKKNNVEFIHISDIDKFAVETLRENFEPFAQNIDIKDLDLKGYEADIILGGFPCQSFSTVNPTKDPYDDRAQLYKQMLRLVGQVKPKVVIGENVKGLALLQKGEILKKIVKEFEELGYHVKHTILNAADYGVPQKRQRLFIVGVRNDIETEFVFPEATHSEGGLLGEPWVPLSKVIDNLAIDDKKYYFSERAVQGLKNAKNNMKRGLAQDLNAPSLTLTSHLAKVSLNSRDPVLLVDKDKELYRRFTVREAARIQSFPDDFKFPVSDHQAYRQIGNAIPPVLMWHMSQQALKVLNSEKITE